MLQVEHPLLELGPIARCDVEQHVLLGRAEVSRGRRSHPGPHRLDPVGHDQPIIFTDGPKKLMTDGTY